jgi:choline transport protein
MCLACLNIGSYTAFSAFISLASLALFTSYAIAISCMLYARLVGGMQRAHWSFGAYGVSINIFALIYTGWMMVIFCFPTYTPVTGENFNYALPIFAFVVIVAMILWFARARKAWPGLNKEIIDSVMANADKNTKE